MRQLGLAAPVMALTVLVGTAWAESKATPSGTWKWKVKFGGQEREFTLKPKPEGGKLTGTVVGSDSQQQAVEDSHYKDGGVSFQVTRERDGQEFTTHYKGKVGGDTTKGKAESGRGVWHFPSRRQQVVPPTAGPLRRVGG